jgi:hypothetical protein
MNFLFKNGHWDEIQACAPHAQCTLGLPRSDHRIELAWLGAANSQRGRPTGRDPRLCTARTRRGALRARVVARFVTAHR